MGKHRRIWELALPAGAKWPAFEAPPENGRRYLEMLKIEPGGKYDCWLLSDSLLSQWVHYLDDRTVPCLVPLGALCEFCGPKTSKRWESFLAVYSERHKKHGIVRITEGCYKSNVLLKGAKGDLTGKRLVLWRTGGHRRGRLLARLDLLSERAITLEDRWTLEALRGQLFWIWGVRPKGETDNGNS